MCMGGITVKSECSVKGCSLRAVMCLHRNVGGVFESTLVQRSDLQEAGGPCGQLGTACLGGVPPPCPSPGTSQSSLLVPLLGRGWATVSSFWRVCLSVGTGLQEGLPTLAVPPVPSARSPVYQSCTWGGVSWSFQSCISFTLAKTSELVLASSCFPLTVRSQRPAVHTLLRTQWLCLHSSPMPVSTALGGGSGGPV